MKAVCETCLYWRDPVEYSNYSECLLTSLEAHETLTTQFVYVAGEDEDGERAWIPLEDNEETITAILHTRRDYGCVQYEHNPQLSEL